MALASSTVIGSRSSNQSNRSASVFIAFSSLALTSLRKDAFPIFIYGLYLSLRYFFWRAMGLLRRNCGASLRTSGTVSSEEFQWRGLDTLVNMKAVLLARDFGNRSDKVESA